MFQWWINMRKNRILYSVLFFLSASFIYFYGGKIPYMLFYTVVLLPLVSLTITSIAFLRFKYVENVAKQSVVKGEEVNYSFCINNEDFFLYPYIRVNFYSNDTVFAKQFQSKTFSLLPRSKKTFNFKLTCKYRGEYLLGIRSIEFEDYLGIFKLTHKPVSAKPIVVLPRLIKLDKLHLNINCISESESLLSNQYESTMAVSDIRKYAFGDSLRKIHWKLSSKMNELLVKNYEGATTTNCAIILDFKKNNYTVEQNTIIEDKLIESSIAVIYYCLSNYIPINLTYYTQGFVEIEANNPLQFEGIYSILSKIKFDHDVNVKDVLDIYTGKDSLIKSNIMLFTSNLSFELYDKLYDARLLGYDVNLIYISPNVTSDSANNEINNILKELPEMGITTYRINPEDDIKNVLETLLN